MNLWVYCHKKYTLGWLVIQICKHVKQTEDGVHLWTVLVKKCRSVKKVIYLGGGATRQNTQNNSLDSLVMADI